MSANWTGLNQYGGVDLTAAQSSATLTLSGLPDHVVLSVSGYGEPGGSQSPEDPDTLTVTIGDQPAQTIVYDGINPPATWGFGGTFAHDEDTLTITLQGDLGEYNALTLFNLTVDTVDPVITVSVPGIVTGETEQAVATVTDPSGNPLEGVEVSAENDEPAYAELQQTSGTTNGDGKAFFDIKGLKETLAGGAQTAFSILGGLLISRIDVVVRDPVMTMELSSTSVYVGQELIGEVSLRNPFSNAPIERVAITVDSDGGFLDVTEGSLVTQDDGKDYATAFGFKRTPPGDTVKLVAHHPSNPAKDVEIDVTVKAISVVISPVDKPWVLVPLNPFPGFPLEVLVLTRDPDTNAILSGIRLTGWVGNVLIADIAGNSVLTTNQQGEAKFELVGINEGDTTFTVRAGDDFGLSDWTGVRVS